VRALIEAGLRPHVFGPPMDVDLLSDLRGRFDETEGSVEDRDAIGAALAASGARYAITCAAHSVGEKGLMRSGELAGDKALSVNVLGLRNVFEAAREAGVGRVVWTSSTVVYGPAETYGAERVAEDAPLAPRTFYGLTKRLGEDVAHYVRDRHGLAVTGLRLPIVIGPGLWYAGAAAAIAAVVNNARPGGRHEVAFHDDPVDLMHAADVGEAVVAALDPDRAPAAIYNINGFTVRMSDIIAAAMARVPGYHVEHDRVPAAISFPLVDDARFRRDAGHAPRRGLAEVVDDMLAARES
jgi:UDP-glucose 4-epimerase